MVIQFSGNAIWQLVAQSDLITKLVLLVLLAMSVICWTVFLYKIILFRIKRYQIGKTLHYLNDIHTFDELRTMINTLSDTFPGYFLKKNLAMLKSLLDVHPEAATLNDKELQLLQQGTQQLIDDFLNNEEKYLPVLFTCASVSPLLGLFGTVWGLVHAFVRIAQQQSADITTVAPGIAEALITTLAGLVVAIPALMMYHFLVSKVRVIEQYLCQSAQKFSWIVQRVFVFRCMAGDIGMMHIKNTEANPHVL